MGAEAGRKKREAQVPVNLVTGVTATHVVNPYFGGLFGHHLALAPVTSPFTAHPNGALVPQEPADVVGPVRLISPPLPRPEGRSVRLRHLSTWSPVWLPPPTSTPGLDTTWLWPPSPPPSPPTPTEPSSPRSPLMLPRPVLPTSRRWPPPASRKRET